MPRGDPEPLRARRLPSLLRRRRRRRGAPRDMQRAFGTLREMKADCKTQSAFAICFASLLRETRYASRGPRAPAGAKITVAFAPQAQTARGAARYATCLRHLARDESRLQNAVGFRDMFRVPSPRNSICLAGTPNPCGREDYRRFCAAGAYRVRAMRARIAQERSDCISRLRSKHIAPTGRKARSAFFRSPPHIVQ